ncbi:hypothetical protein ZIOFF_007365 [Zingiber officinale]|uniref:Uncharacterized protein n=1 Tax=Zingiber officinale TaxID=94328 RepID=A0A8J5HPY6_ZINOF|nr:hypothetical protein ZIOFF_007365 [Zingiber officinale]
MKASHLGDGGTKCLPRRGSESGNRRASRKPMMVSATVIPHSPAIYTTLSTADEMRALLVPIKGDNKESYKYKDNWFDLLAIHYLTKAIQATTGTSNKKQGYEGLVEAAVMISKKHGTKAQQNLVIQTLQKAFPVAILTMASELSYKDFIASVHVYKRILCSFHYIVLPMANWPLRGPQGNHLGNKTKEPRSTKGVLNASRRGAYVPGVLHAMSKLDLIGHSCAIHPFNLASEKKHSIPSLLFKWLLQGRPFPNEVDRTPVTSNLIPQHSKADTWSELLLVDDDTYQRDFKAISKARLSRQRLTLNTGKVLQAKFDYYNRNKAGSKPSI